MRLLLLSLALGCASGCADVKGIENGKAWGPVTSMIDLFTSCQLLETSAGPVLFDACWRKGELEARLKERGHVPADVIAVLLTHGHADHVGGLEVLTSARIFAFEAEQPNITKNGKGDTAIDEVLTDGAVLTFGEHQVRVFSVPGHTGGSAVFLVGGTLIIGDSGLFTGKGDFGPVPEDRSEDPAGLITSMVALSARLDAEGREINAILPAHSGGVEGKGALDAFAAARR